MKQAINIGVIFKFKYPNKNQQTNKNNKKEQAIKINILKSITIIRIIQTTVANSNSPSIKYSVGKVQRM